MELIKNETEYKEALERLENIFDADLNTAAGQELEVLSKSIENYENEHFPIELPDAIEAKIFRTEQMNLNHS